MSRCRWCGEPLDTTDRRVRYHHHCALEHSRAVHRHYSIATNAGEARPRDGGSPARTLPSVRSAPNLEGRPRPMPEVSGSGAESAGRSAQDSPCERQFGVVHCHRWGCSKRDHTASADFLAALPQGDAGVEPDATRIIRHIA